MRTKYSYGFARVITQITAFVFFPQLVLEVIGVITRKEGFEWVLPVCGVTFLIAILYSLILVILNAHDKYQS